MKRLAAQALLFVALSACSDSGHNAETGDNHISENPGLDAGLDAGDAAQSEGAADTSNSDGVSTPVDTGAGDGGGQDGGSGDAGGAETDAGTDAASDMSSTDPDVGADTGSSGGYDTTGWDMKRTTLSDSASVGTPDSYFFDVDSGSPLSASITGGGSGSWSVNVFGGYSNYLYCTALTSCQVMLRPEDVTVIVTAITTDIGSYSLTIDYAGMGLQ